MKPTTEIAFILDRSGSMDRLVETAISGFNSFLTDQKETKDDARLTLVLFDDQYEVPYHSRLLQEVSNLDTTTFVPRGSTALLDAIGRTIDDLGARLAALPEAERPRQVVVAILTDGYENASAKYTHPQIAQMIAHQRDTYHWRFFFLAANQDAIATAASMNIDRDHAMSFAAQPHALYASQRTVSRKLSALRKSTANFSMSAQEDADLVAPLSQIGEEETRKSGEQN